MAPRGLGPEPMTTGPSSIVTGRVHRFRARRLRPRRRNDRTFDPLVRRTNNGGAMPEKGPAVFLDYDQAALDAAYDQAAYAPNREQLIQRRIRDSELARASASPSASPTDRPRSSGSTSTAAVAKPHRSLSSSMAAHGAAGIR